jgi:hypothetical protein
MILVKDFKEFVESLNANEVRYLVTGGYAVALHGHPRYTKDLDIWVDLTPENAERIVAALKDFGFGSLELAAADFVEPDQIVQLGYPPNRIDLITSLPGVDFDSCFERRVSVDVGGVTAAFIDRDDLIRNKLASARPQDLADVQNLE